MHHFAEKNKGRYEVGGHDHAHNAPLAPKPRRPGSPIPELLRPLKCTNHSGSEGRSGIINMIAENGGHAKDIGREEAATMCCGCSPKCYSGSPPGRSENPLVHDVRFIHQAQLLSPLTRTKLSDKFGLTSSPAPM